MNWLTISTIGQVPNKYSSQRYDNLVHPGSRLPCDQGSVSYWNPRPGLVSFWSVHLHRSTWRAISKVNWNAQTLPYEIRWIGPILVTAPFNGRVIESVIMHSIPSDLSLPLHHGSTSQNNEHKRRSWSFRGLTLFPSRFTMDTYPKRYELQSETQHHPILAHIFIIGAHLPPGPPGKVIFGNVYDIPKKHEWETYTQWANKYGMSFLYR